MRRSRSIVRSKSLTSSCETTLASYTAFNGRSMRRLLIRPGAIGDCILSLPALEYLTADYTEVWISSPLVPLIQFADAVRPLSSTGLDLLGVGDLPMAAGLMEKLRTFDSVVSWYGT